MPWFRFIAGQLGHPRGWFGRRVMAPILDRTNREIIEAVLGALKLAPDDRFLDVGFGGGVSLEIAAERVTGGSVCGVDRAADMVARARERLADLVDAGRLRLEVGDVAELPLRDDSYDKVATINTVYFWPDLDVALDELVRVLSPGGRLAVAFSGARKMQQDSAVTRHGFRIIDSGHLVDALRRRGLRGVEALALDGVRTQGDFVVVGEKPTGRAGVSEPTNADRDDGI